MHLFLQICGVAGFGLLGAVAIEWKLLSTDNMPSSNFPNVMARSAASLALISTYFIFG